MARAAGRRPATTTRDTRSVAWPPIRSRSWTRFLAQPRGFPERLIGGDPEFFLRHMLSSWAGSPGCFSEDAFAEYLRSFRDPDVIHATCEDYRAGATVDYRLDEADLESGRKIGCPLLALWGDKGRPHKRRQVLRHALTQRSGVR